MENPYCRRCGFSRLIKLQKMLVDDHDVYRCGQCGYIFSPSDGGIEDGGSEAPQAAEQELPPAPKDGVRIAGKMIGIPRDRLV